MQDVILLVSTSAIFIFGYFLMKKLDVFLENNWNRQETALTYGENSLRIGFSNPLMAGSLSDVLETYGKQHPDVSIHIFSGEEISHLPPTFIVDLHPFLMIVDVFFQVRSRNRVIYTYRGIRDVDDLKSPA